MRLVRPRRRRLTWGPLAFLAPFFTLFVLFFLLPIGYAIVQSLLKTTSSGLGLGPTTTTFAGVGNYGRVLSDPQFTSGVGRVLLFGIVQVPVMLGLALLLALLLDSGLVRFQKVFRLAFFVPYGIPGVMAAILWAFLYVPGLSPIVDVLNAGPTGSPDFLASGSLLWSIANIVTWEYTGYNMIIIFAALQAIPQDLYEAARLDGASEWGIATRLKVPMVRPALILTAVFSIIGTLQLFSEPQVLRAITSGVSSTYTPNLMSYTAAFSSNDYHFAAAISVTLAVGTFLLSFGFLRFTRRTGVA